MLPPRAPVMPAAAVRPTRLRLLCLHGFRTSGVILKEQVREGFEKGDDDANESRREEGAFALTDARSGFFFSTSTSTSAFKKKNSSQLEIARLDRDLSDLAELVTVDAPHLATGQLLCGSLFLAAAASRCPSTKTKKKKSENSLTSLSLSLSIISSSVATTPPGPVPSDVPWPPPHYEWWNAVEVENGEESGSGGGDDRGGTRRRGRGGGGKTFVYQGFEETLSHVASVLDRQGPFDGFLAFSQGTILASLLLAAWSKADEARERGEGRYPSSGLTANKEGRGGEGRG